MKRSFDLVTGLDKRQQGTERRRSQGPGLCKRWTHESAEAGTEPHQRVRRKMSVQKTRVSENV